MQKPRLVLASILFACGPSAKQSTLPSLSSLVTQGPVQLDATSWTMGQVVTARVTFENTGNEEIVVQSMAISGLPPGGTHASGPFLDFQPPLGATTVAAHQTVSLSATRALNPGDPMGRWEIYPTVKDVHGAGHDYSSAFISAFINASAGADAATGSSSVTTTPAPSGSPTPPVTVTAPTAPSTPDAGWLSTQGNKIVHADGTVWAGRGVNLADTRGCGACVGSTPNVDEVLRRIDLAVDTWHATFIRLDLESYSGSGTNSQPVTADAGYLADVETIVRHIESKSGVYVLLSLWVDPTFSAVGWPTTQTQPEWQLLANTFANDAHVMFGLVNEPQSNEDGSLDSACWDAMSATVATIREVEQKNGTPAHIISAQGTRNWARVLDYYVTHPLGPNVIYETHVYDPTANFQALFVTPSQTLPVVIGEFGPQGMTTTDTANLMQQAEQLQIPYLAWTFHMRCPPNLLVDNSGGSCGVGMTLQPTAWGQQLMDQLAQPPAVATQ